MAFYRLNDIHNSHNLRTKFDSTDNRRQTDRQTENHFFRVLGVMKHREHIKVAIRPMDHITIFP